MAYSSIVVGFNPDIEFRRTKTLMGMAAVTIIIRKNVDEGKELIEYLK
ncbi:MAG: hypothetical protein HXS48_10285 [Theionarchaea archaeon]|nr:hypothetical protein [Theionarchaea archaeon]